jgi:N-acetylmuramoyl-L-alanine amidase
MPRHWYIIVAVALLALALTTGAGQPTIVDVVGQLKTNPNKSYNNRSISQIDRYIIHHSASTTATATDFARWHVDQRGWPGIGYHFVIEKDGTIKQTNYLTTVSYHTSEQNFTGVGICLSGNFEIEQPTAAQLASLRSLLGHLRSTVGNYPVWGHRDYTQTACPGVNLYPLVSSGQV